MPDYTTSTGWTVQQNADLESGTPNPGAINPAALDGYVAQSILVEDSITSVTHATTGYLTRIYVPEPGTVTHLDWVQATATGAAAQFGLFTAAALTSAVTPLAWGSASQGSTTGVISNTFNGSSSPTSVSLNGNTFYYIYSYHTGTSTVGCCTASAPALNPNLTTTTPSTATVGSAPTTVTSSTTLNTLTNTLAGSKFWYGLR